MPSYTVTDPQTGRKVTLTGDSPPTEQELEEIFSSLPETTANNPIASEQPKKSYRDVALANSGTPSQMAARSFDTKAQADKRESEQYLSQLEKVNPYQAEVIRNMSPLNAAMANVGAGMTDIYYGLPFTGDNPNLDLAKDLEKSTSGSAFRALGQAAPFMAAGGLVSPALSLSARTGISAGIGGAEGGIVANSQGLDAGSVAANTLLGAAVGAGGEIIGSGLNRVLGALSKKYKKPLDELVKDGQPTPQLNSILEKEGMTIDDLAAPAATEQLAKDVSPSSAIRRADEIASNITINPERAAAAERLGVDAPVVTLTDDKAAHEVAGALLAVPGSRAAKDFNEYTQALTKSAEDIVEQSKGSLDKGLVNDELKAAMQEKISQLSKDSSGIYQAIRDAVPESTIVNTRPLVNDLKSLASKSSRGINGLSKVEQDVYQVANNKPTYFDIDNLRKDIGASIGKSEGTYTTEQSATLKRLYSQLTQLQEGVAKEIAPNAADLWKQAKELDKSRFKLQEGSEFLFDKGLVGSVSQKAESAVKSLAKGNTKLFNQVIDSVPEDYRDRVLMTALDSTMRKTYASGPEISANDFAKFWGELSRSPTNKKTLVDKLPEGAGQRLEDLYLLAQGLTNVTRNKTKTGIVDQAFKDFDKTDGIVGKLYGFAKASELAPSASVRIAGKLAEAATSARTPAVEAADNLLASPEFKTAVLSQTKDQKVRNIAEARLKKTKAYQEWLNKQSNSTKAAIGTTGFIPFLVGGEEE